MVRQVFVLNSRWIIVPILFQSRYPMSGLLRSCAWFNKSSPGLGCAFAKIRLWCSLFSKNSTCILGTWCISSYWTLQQYFYEYCARGHSTPDHEMGSKCRRCFSKMHSQMYGLQWVTALLSNCNHWRQTTARTASYNWWLRSSRRVHVSPFISCLLSCTSRGCTSIIRTDSKRERNSTR